jgi:4-hydroxybenzoate polyprenyltransferase
VSGINRGRRRFRSLIANVILTSHPLPTAAVTGLVTVLAIAAETPATTVAVLAGAVLAGQLSVGLLNDLIDVDRDRSSARRDKPLATGAISPRPVWIAFGCASAACVSLSVALGPAPALAHLTAVAGAWAYNLGLKSTVWSWLPYAVGFGLLPVAVWLVAPVAGMPPWWLVAAAASLGVGAHCANVLPDLAADRATGVHGLPHRLPERIVRAGTAAVLLVGLALATFGPAQPIAGWEPAVLAVGIILAGVAVVTPTPRQRATVIDGPHVEPRRQLIAGRAPFLAVIAIGGLAVAVFVARGATG